jgi:hypothetical protein
VGNELSWVAYTSFAMATPKLPVLDTASLSGPGAFDISEKVPDHADYKEIRKQNAGAVKDTGDEERVAIVAGGAVVLIGGGTLPARPTTCVAIAMSRKVWSRSRREAPSAGHRSRSGASRPSRRW